MKSFNPSVVAFPSALIERALKAFKTPFFLYEERGIGENCRLLKDALGGRFPGFTPLFAVKANSNPHILRIIMDEGFGMDCSSPVDVLLCRRLGSWGMYSGNYCTREEYELVLDGSDMLLNLDDLSDLEVLRPLGCPDFLSFRINPGVAKADLETNLLAGREAKFGIPWEKAVEAYRQARSAGVKRFGLHMMTGSNILDPAYFHHVTAKLLSVAGEIHRSLGIDIETVNIGGGFGVPYRPEEESLDLEELGRGLREVFDEECPRYNLREPRLMIEPGRFITCNAGFLVTQVHALKESYKRFVGVDAGTNDLPRPAVYGAYHHISVLGREGETASELVNVVGRLCENNDHFAKDRPLPPIKRGDVLVIHNAGAHSYSMGHNYNNRPRSSEILATSSGELQLIRRQETSEDLLRTVVGWPG